jgi:asparagine synthase (glutamine-hydrolysing)
MGPIFLSFPKSDPVSDDADVPASTVVDDYPMIHGSIRLSRRDASHVHIDIPLTSTEQLYYRREQSELLISSDLRRLYRPGDQLDEKAIYGLYQFGAVVPPSSPWQGVTRFVPGKEFELDCNTTGIQELGSNASFNAETSAPEIDKDAMTRVLVDLLDRILIESCPNQDPIILFSGGVDSGVLASRAAALGWKKTTLVNYCLDRDDAESALAARMAKQLGLEFTRVDSSRTVDPDFLAELAAAYSSPFGDYSALPTYRLSRAVQQRFAPSRVVIDGTGADAIFGMFPKAAGGRRLYRIPRLLRQCLAAPYPLDSIWLRPSRAEFLLRICRRSFQMHAPAAAIARNPLRDIAFQVSRRQYQSVAEDIETWLDSTGLPVGLEYRLPAIDLILGTANIFAQKNASLFDSHDRRIVYPFMDMRIARLALSSERWIDENRSPKAILKKILADVVPNDMVYRRKSGFTVPAAEYFSDPKFVSILDSALKSDTISAQSWGIGHNLQKIRDRLADGIPMPEHMYHFVWTIVFFYLWLEACMRRHSG